VTAVGPGGPRATRPRLGVFGGAFDPPHATHVALALAALDQLQLTELRVFPTGQAWHKARALTPAEHRLAMARLAFDSLPGVVVDDRELRRAGPTYTIDTLRELAAEQPDAERVLLMGADQARSLMTWREWEAIVALATIAVAERLPTTPSPEPVALDDLPWARHPAARIERLRLPPTDASATEVRDRLARGLGIVPLVPEPVARYIERHRLYLPT
jgi:nicotinate-nucleotide adenylyltransferase